MLIEGAKVIEIVVSIFERLGISYLIGGSIASGVHGIYRYTNDIDFVADIHLPHVPSLLEALHDFYADEDMIRDAIETRSSFSILHLQIMTKVDVFIKADDAWTNQVWKRRKYLPVSSDGSVSAYLPSPEDAVLQKLRWFQMGGGVSDRQWSDILGMLKMRSGTLDRDYLRQWAHAIGVADLLEKALQMSSSE